MGWKNAQQVATFSGTLPLATDFGQNADSATRGVDENARVFISSGPKSAGNLSADGPEAAEEGGHA